MRRTPLKTRYRDTGPDKATVEGLLTRCGWMCESCDDALRGNRGEGWHVHHRRPRGSGGSSWPGINLASNLLVLCAFCHGDVESRRAHAVEVGRLVPYASDPGEVAVLVQQHWRYLTDEFTYSLNPPAHMS